MLACVPFTWKCKTPNSLLVHWVFLPTSVALSELNAKLSSLGPQNFKQDFVRGKERKNQQTAVGRQNIKVSSMSGITNKLHLNSIK